ncbi:hypothetical protein F4553_001744 [Allocatelliglobosispora scoriae]|uniref:Uncharacterized protein n=1 Tax=Allocatelliglobosispora scoriae TaxID=643052 RepID=A0A841BL54_9ACTN|nr:hypothetical protein [Allocatelliglobosispora scoriae]MBB5868365.1 hypothetical protein [Allocatelliglobosispora scoriae]
MTVWGRQSRRDLGITALVEGFFASAWFGWGGGDAPAHWQTPLIAGSIAAVALAVVGAIVGFSSPAATGVARDRAASRRYGIITGVEFTVAGIGAAILGTTGQAEFIAPWICLVVGLHFLPLAAVLRDRLLIPLGLLLCCVAVAGTAVGLFGTIAADAVTGAGAGVLLLTFGAIALVTGLRTPKGESTPVSAAG